MNNKCYDDIVRRYLLRASMLIVLLSTGCAQWDVAPTAPPQPVIVELPPAPVVTQTEDVLPPLDAIVIAEHRQCQKPAAGNALASEERQIRELMQWLKRSCGINDATLASQLTTLKQLRQRYTWPEAYTAWLDEWRRNLLRMHMLQQRAATAEEAQATMVKRLRAIERDLTTRP